MILFRIAKARPQRRVFVSLFPLRVAFVLGFALALAGQGIGQIADSNESQDEVIRGTVINAATQAPIPRALVYSADNRYAALTDGEGHFEFALPAEHPQDMGTTMSYMYAGPVYSAPHGQISGVVGSRNTMMFMARKPGFLDDPSQSTAVNLSGDEIKISLLPEAIIKGRVTAAGGEPAAGVTVQVFSREVQDGLPRWVTRESVRANSAGEFRFAELLPGTYKIVTQEWMDNDPVAFPPGAQVYGYPPVSYPGVAEPSAAATIEVGAGQSVEADVPIARQPYYQVRIPVANNEFIGGFNVSVQGQDGSRYELGYNQAKQGIEGMLPSGNYLVRASGYGPNSASGSVSIRVADAPLLQGPILTLVPNSSIPLNVKEEFTDTTWRSFGSVGRGIAFRARGPRSYLQASVESMDEFEHRGGSLRAPTASNDDELVLESLPPGRYWLRLSTSRGYVSSASLGSTDLLRQPLVIGSGATAPIEITLRDDGAELEGSITSVAEQNASANASPTMAWVYCIPMPDSAGQLQTIGVSQDGRFDVQMMVPGDYRVLAFSKPQPRLPYRDPEGMKTYETKGQVVHLTAGQKTAVQLQIVSETE